MTILTALSLLPNWRELPMRPTLNEQRYCAVTGRSKRRTPKRSALGCRWRSVTWSSSFTMGTDAFSPVRTNGISNNGRRHQPISSRQPYARADPFVWFVIRAYLAIVSSWDQVQLITCGKRPGLGGGAGRGRKKQQAPNSKQKGSFK